MDAERKSLGEVRGSRELRLCPEVSSKDALPSPDDAFRFRQQVEAMYRDESSTDLAIADAEGEAVWVLDYTRHRLAGKSHDQARQAVFQTISALVGQ